MSLDRRTFLAGAASAAAAAGLPGRLHAELLGPRHAGSRPWLDLAVECARWIDASRQPDEHGVRYPADPLKPESVDLDFYNGMTGVVAFQAALASATGDRRWRDVARKGADHLVHQIDTAPPERLGAGLYTGVAGIGYTLLTAADAGLGDQYRDAARRATDRLAATAKAIGDGVEWSDSNDIISGTAGVGLWLLAAAGRWKDSALIELAARAGNRLLETSEPAEGGRMWFPGASLKRNYPNFSHGTSGVGYFLASLHRATGERNFLEAALEGVRYLDRIAHRENGATKIFHQSGGGENRYYLSWCHGPVGTARLFYRLHEITGETRWLEWVDSLTKATFESGIPEQRTEGYWENVSQCCGNVGIGQYCIDLVRYHRTPTATAFRARIEKDLIRRATRDDKGLRWVQAENRTQPTNLVAQTGFMQGAAGMGTWFLQLDALERGHRWRFPQPDTPFRG